MHMQSIRELLSSAPLSVPDAELRRREGMERFAQYLPAEADDIWARALSKFVTTAPWRYWDPATVEQDSVF